MSAAQYVGEAMAPLQPAVDITVREAFDAIKLLCDPDVLYTIEFDEADGMLFKRFSRALPVEAWIVAVPVDDEGRLRRDKQMLVAALAFTPKVTHDFTLPTFASQLRHELAALVAADS